MMQCNFMWVMAVCMFPAMQLAQYVQRVMALEQERDELTVRLQRAQQIQQPQQSQSPQQPPRQQQQRPQPSATATTTSGSNASSLAAQQELFELRLQRDQAQASVRRLRERITELFGPTAVDEPQMVSPSAGAKRSGSGGGVSGGGGIKRQKSAQQREADLLSTVNQLKSALERAMTSTTPNTRFMQVSLVRSPQDGCSHNSFLPSALLPYLHNVLRSYCCCFTCMLS